MNLSDLHNHLVKISDHANNVIEHWDTLVIDGGAYETVLDDLEVVLQIDTGTSLILKLNDETQDIETFQQAVRYRILIDSWQIILNKESYLNQIMDDNDTHIIWFLKQSSFETWSSEIVPFATENNLFKDHHATKILVSDLDVSFGGPLLAIDSVNEERIPENWPRQTNSLSEDDIKRQVHVLSHSDGYLSPNPFLLDWGDLNSKASERFRYISGLVLCSCITQEFYSPDKVVLKGARRIELALTKPEDMMPNIKELDIVLEAVRWLYEERVEVRAALISDRLSLDISDTETLLSGVSKYIKEALKQSKEQYEFVIQERKEAYYKELRDVLKDVQSQAALFSQKARNIMNSLLRDVLAALLFISIGLFSRVGRTQEVLSSAEADLLFKALAVYLVVSLALQVIIHLSDLYLANRELNYWVDATRTQISKSDIKRHLNKPLMGRRIGFYLMLIFLSIFYLSLAQFAWDFQRLLSIFGVL